MRVLLDECVPRPLRAELNGHAVRTVGEMGWSGIVNGQLLGKASQEFDCFLTVDKNMQFQQSIPNLPVAVIVVCAVNNKLESLKPLMPLVREALTQLQPRELRRIGA
jgi:hypothetical protein